MPSEIETLSGHLDDAIGRVAEAVDGLTSEELVWRPAAANANTAGILATHVLGNIRQHALGITCGQTDVRDRAREFAEPINDAAELVKRARSLRSEVASALTALPDGALDEAREHPVRGTITAREALMIPLRHAAEHLGQIELTRDLARAAGVGAGGVRALHHAAITVPTERLDEARRFYSDVLGLRETERPDAELGRPGIWYGFGVTELHIQCRDGAKPDASDRHPALIVGDLDSLKTRLREHGVEIKDAPTLMGRERCFCRDPFGNRIELMTAP